MCIVQVNLKMLLDIFSDARVVAPLLRAANLHSGNQRASYLYIFDHVTQNGYYPPQVLYIVVSNGYYTLLELLVNQIIIVAIL